MAEGVLGPNGFEKRNLTTLLKELKDGLQAAFPDPIIFDESSPDTQQIGIVANEYIKIWDFLLEMWNQLDPQHANGIMLDRVNENIRGIPRKLRNRTKVTCQLAGVAGTLIPANSIVKMDGADEIFKLISNVVLDVSGNGTGSFECTVDGPVIILAGDIDTIVTPIAGWATVGNSSDGVVGRDDETDPEYRIRGRETTEIRGQGYDDAIYSGLMNVIGVSKAKVYHNRESTTDSNGLVSKGLSCYVIGGTDQDIIDVIFTKANFGVVFVGAITGYGIDVRGNQHQIKFSRPADVQIYINVDVVEVAGWSLGKVQEIKDSIVAYFNGTQNIQGLESGYEIAETVRASNYYAGLSKMTGFHINSIEVKKGIGGTFAQSAPLNWNEYPVIDEANITVTHAP